MANNDVKAKRPRLDYSLQPTWCFRSSAIKHEGLVKENKTKSDIAKEKLNALFSAN